MGWGGTAGTELGWGALEWGAGGDTLQLLRADAVRENCVRLFFSVAVKFTAILDVGDASDRAKYTITPVAGSVGLDSKPARAVMVAFVERVDATTIDVWLDRPMSPYPSQYLATVRDLVNELGDPIDVSSTSVLFDGVYRGVAPNTAQAAMPRRDIANPDGLVGVTNPDPALQFGAYVADETGDYATDAGMSSFRKRVRRRIASEEDGFAHLPGYGAGIRSKVKTLGRPEVQQTTAARIEEQIKQEPETVSVAVRFEQDPRVLNVFWLVVVAVANTGEVVNEKIGIDPTSGG